MDYEMMSSEEIATERARVINRLKQTQPNKPLAASDEQRIKWREQVLLMNTVLQERGALLPGGPFAEEVALGT